MLLHRFGIILALLGALALGLAGYAPAQAADLPASAHLDMNEAEMASHHAEVMEWHDCCPEGSMDHGVSDPATKIAEMDCDDMTGCADGPCGLAAAAVPLLLDGAVVPISHSAAMRHGWVADQPVEIAPPGLEHPPRA